MEDFIQMMKDCGILREHKCDAILGLYIIDKDRYRHRTGYLSGEYYEV